MTRREVPGRGEAKTQHRRKKFVRNSLLRYYEGTFTLNHFFEIWLWVAPMGAWALQGSGALQVSPLRAFMFVLWKFWPILRILSLPSWLSISQTLFSTGRLCGTGHEKLCKCFAVPPLMILNVMAWQSPGSSPVPLGVHRIEVKGAPGTELNWEPVNVTCYCQLWMPWAGEQGSRLSSVTDELQARHKEE